LSRAAGRGEMIIMMGFIVSTVAAANGSFKACEGELVLVFSA
jgi:hypothetical protein